MTQQLRNLLFILSDDQGAWALGAAGNHELRTPVLDDLASSGARLDNLFCVSPVCSPARASLLTGSIPSAHGVHDYLDGPASGPKGRDFLEGHPMFTDELVAAGYRIGLIGKWHLGASDQPRSGFDTWYAVEGGAAPYYGATVFDGAQRTTVDGYLTEALAARACAFVGEAESDSRPFALLLHFTAPHRPWRGQHPSEYTTLYDDCPFETTPQEPPHPFLAMRDGMPIAREPDERDSLVGYFASITAMDSAIGRVLESLQNAGAGDDTLVIFLSDNGFNAGHHGIWGKGNGTLPMNMYDTSVKVPGIVRYPGRVPAGTVLDDLVSGYDIAATVLDLLGLDTASFEAGPGRSRASAIRGHKEGDSGAIVVYDEYGSVRMIRSREWKYIHRYPVGPHELYDLVDDPGERVNLANDPTHVARVSSMRKELHEWFAQHGTRRADGAGLPVTGGGQIDVIGDDPLGAFAPRGTS